MDTRKKPKSDAELFREAMENVTPLPPANRHPANRPRPPAHPAQSERDEAEVLEELLGPVDDAEGLETGEEMSWLRPGRPQRLLRRLKRGYFRVCDTIDLHHLREEAARQVLIEFLAASERARHDCVRIVHGKGLRSRGGPKLKRLTHHVLRRHPAVIAFTSCRPVDGGTGAVNVLLTTRRKSRA